MDLAKEDCHLPLAELLGEYDQTRPSSLSKTNPLGHPATPAD